MFVYLTKRLLWMIPSLFGISLLIFLLLDLVPADRAEVEMQRRAANQDIEAREEAVLNLRIRYGLVDRVTHEPRSVWERYWNWLVHASQLDFADPGEDPAQFRERFLSALAVSALVGLSAMLVALIVGLVLGGYLGMRAGGMIDRGVSGFLLVCYGLPEFLLATLVLLAISTESLVGMFPGAGLRSEGSENWSLPDQMLDLGWHLLLPVLIIALGPSTTLLRFVRESVSRAAASPFVQSLRGWGFEERQIRARVLRHGLTPLATMASTLLPMLVSGSLVVEMVFALPGLTPMVFAAISAREYALVMAGLMLVAIVVLLSMVISDLLHRCFDPRVQLK
ncbi:MAG: ABC transporter permease [Planctomycetota bacterium]|jgi:peptide/nickel transport system permease protein